MSSTTEIRGLAPRDELRPAGEADLSDILAKANADGDVCYLAGGLTKQDWGAAPAHLDLLVRTGALSGCTDVDPDNLTLSAMAGTTVAEARAQAEAVGRILPIDPGQPGEATIGGVVAAGDNGPRAAGYGGLRDVVLGVRALLADGSAVKFGGRTMKNVTGYDMTKLFVGSFGALGAITEVTFRLLPRYDSQALLILPLASLDDAKRVTAGVLGSYLQPLALEVVSADALPGGDAAGAGPAGAPVLLAGFGGHRAAVDRSVREVTETVPGAAPRVLHEEEASAMYGHLADGAAASGGTLALRASVPISRTIDVLAAAQTYAAANGLTLGYRAGAARGRVDLTLRGEGTNAAAGADGGAARFGACPAHLRAQAVDMGGSLFVTGGAALLPEGYDAWGDAGGAVAIMRRIKERFDPNGILAPGRFVGGI